MPKMFFWFSRQVGVCCFFLLVLMATSTPGPRLQYSNRPFPPLYTHRTRTRTPRPQATSAGARRRLLTYTELAALHHFSL